MLLKLVFLVINLACIVKEYVMHAVLAFARHLGISSVMHLAENRVTVLIFNLNLLTKSIQKTNGS